MSSRFLAAIAAALVVTAPPAIAQNEPQPMRTALSVPQQLEDPESADVQVIGHVLEPKRLDPTPERLGQLRMPPGFSVKVFADGLVNPRMLAVAGDGTVYVTRRSVGDVVMLKDDIDDGRADTRETVASRPGMHGIAIDGDTVYLATNTEVYRTTRRGDGAFEPLERIIDDLPDAGQHPNRTLAVGPDGKLYISVGSTCNACAESSPESAAMLRAEVLDAMRGHILAAGEVVGAYQR